ncbi:tRNA pseudouridine(55) synthase TruB [Frankia sp. AgKG'84/4]|uniref:tRNA pseudouridine(55) synthase TruB n=1 Tax=Frankia sp. AgKG'84/4 TaxID=573490 RepID=UPI00200E0587|nr:tRNA pseudouridine(55) synthase TruB [Frankia sp. AgKG'84/4]MCL9794773.1 tRNA pseudouridine(55) synthase TruB [Frankia sp. AgKG'84/4]
MSPRSRPVAGPQVDGLVVVDKPAGCTSHDVVARARRILGQRRVGHAGTLDPMATGVLLLGAGRGTRLLGHLALTDKVYDATIRLGRTTTTDDAQGEPLEDRPVDVEPDRLAREMAALTGVIDQVPSSVSAVKVDGVRAYARVRAGEQVTLAARRVTVHRFDLLARRGTGGTPDPAGTDLDVTVSCSSGTYIRALARDLGAALGCGGHLTALRRTVVGPFGLDRAVSLDTFGELGRAAVTPLAEAVAAGFARRDVPAPAAVDVSHGRRLAPVGQPGTYGVFGPDGAVLALVEETADAVRSLVVFAPA